MFIIAYYYSQRSPQDLLTFLRINLKLYLSLLHNNINIQFQVSMLFFSLVNSNYFANDKAITPTSSQLDRAATVLYHHTR